MICYKDKTFCPKTECLNAECPRRFDKAAYKEFCEKHGGEFPVAWFCTVPDSCPNHKSEAGKDRQDSEGK